MDVVSRHWLHQPVKYRVDLHSSRQQSCFFGKIFDILGLITKTSKTRKENKKEVKSMQAGQGSRDIFDLPDLSLQVNPKSSHKCDLFAPQVIPEIQLSCHSRKEWRLH